LRSIGTSLSALVAATLGALGWTTGRITVRPSGAHFRRAIQTPAPQPKNTRFALVVDEGPGLSGSSMAAAAEWLNAAGFQEIALLPGHGGEPGPAATDEVRHLWASTPRYFTPLEELRWHGLTLEEKLALEAREKMGELREVRGVSAGKWRPFALPGGQPWPAVAATFERQKVLCMGPRSRVLWKFCGLGARDHGLGSATDNAIQRMQSLNRTELVPSPLGTCLGFVGMDWVEGQRLRREDGQNAAIVNHLGRYFLRAARPGLANGEAESAIDRLQNMLYWNAKETLGEEAAERAAGLAEPARNAYLDLAYGDGRPAPHEWVRTSAGKIVKTDCTGHATDHTLVGRQSVLWDLAGAIVEWDLQGTQIESLTRPLVEANVSVDPAALQFYHAAYAAFRMGLTSLSATQAGDDPEEKQRLLTASEHYKQKLTHLLAQA
jgi:hypothetical protein